MAAAATTITTLSYLNGIIHQQVSIDETPNKLLYKKVEVFMEKMQDETSGVPIKTVKSFMSKIPSVFTGTDLIQWIIKKIEVEDTCEALHFAHLVSSHGYIFPIDDHILTVKNDGTFFRFQVPESCCQFIVKKKTIFNKFSRFFRPLTTGLRITVNRKTRITVRHDF
jgi:hypothetical protein